MKMKEGEVLHPTMFKLAHRRPDKNGEVPPATMLVCVRCSRSVPFADLAKNEIEVDLCPYCKGRPEDVWGPDCRKPRFKGRLLAPVGTGA